MVKFSWKNSNLFQNKKKLISILIKFPFRTPKRYILEPPYPNLWKNSIESKTLLNTLK
jgi:hypothetical protein